MPVIDDRGEAILKRAGRSRAYRGPPSGLGAGFQPAGMVSCASSTAAPGQPRTHLNPPPRTP